jgi:hypothetical protein
MHKQINKVNVNGKEAELTIEIKDETITSTMRFFIEGKEQVIFKSSARKKPSGIKLISGPNVSEYLNMREYHSQEHQEIVATVRSNDELEQA